MNKWYGLWISNNQKSLSILQKVPLSTLRNIKVFAQRLPALADFFIIHSFLYFTQLSLLFKPLHRQQIRSVKHVWIFAYFHLLLIMRVLIKRKGQFFFLTLTLNNMIDWPWILLHFIFSNSIILLWIKLAWWLAGWKLIRLKYYFVVFCHDSSWLKNWTIYWIVDSRTYWFLSYYFDSFTEAQQIFRKIWQNYLKLLNWAHSYILFSYWFYFL